MLALPSQFSPVWAITAPPMIIREGSLKAGLILLAREASA